MSFARAVRRPARVALIGAGAGTVATAYVVARPPVLLDSSLPPRPRNLPIYPEPTPEIVLVEQPLPLEEEIRHTRRILTRAYDEARQRVQGAVDQWIGVERAVERKVKEIIPADEPTTPGILYVGVATLTGSVIGRNRLLLRVLLPPTFFLASLNYFLPKTSHNLYAYTKEVESTYFPSLAEQHTQLERQSADAWRQARESVRWTSDWLAGEVKRGVAAVESGTGVKVGEAFGMVKEETGKVLNEVAKKAEEAKEKAEQKIKQEEEPKRLV